jgi:polysaccharide pyruvyl transferase WcaK-like protein
MKQMGCVALADALAPLAARFDRLCVGIAGIAPYHDRLRDALSLVAQIESAAPRGWAQSALEIHPLDIAERIRSSGLVIASSLHYRILAMSFGVPGVSLGVEKSISYAEHWDLGAFGAMDPSAIERAVDAALEPSQSERTTKADVLSRAVLRNWHDAMETIR